jgi:membrane associated rhomboid family serine protease
MSRKAFEEDKFTAVRAMFVHADPLHLYFNMSSLRSLGPLLVKMVGPRRFFALYFTAGIAGSIAQCYYGLVAEKLGFPAFKADKSLGSPEVGSAGASGAISGISAALAISNPFVGITVYGLIPMSGSVFLRYEAVKCLLLAWAGDTINFKGWLGWLVREGHFSHLAGLLVGCAGGMIFRKEFTRLLPVYHPKSGQLIAILPKI